MNPYFYTVSSAPSTPSSFPLVSSPPLVYSPPHHLLPPTILLPSFHLLQFWRDREVGGEECTILKKGHLINTMRTRHSDELKCYITSNVGLHDCFKSTRIMFDHFTKDKGPRREMYLKALGETMKREMKLREEMKLRTMEEKKQREKEMYSPEWSIEPSSTEEEHPTDPSSAEEEEGPPTPIVCRGCYCPFPLLVMFLAHEPHCPKVITESGKNVEKAKNSLEELKILMEEVKKWQ